MNRRNLGMLFLPQIGMKASESEGLPIVVLEWSFRGVSLTNKAETYPGCFIVKVYDNMHI